jgi:hypothetical protein
MDLGFMERQGLKLLGWRLRSMKGINRWLPVVATVVVIVCTILRLAGYPEAADAILGVVRLLGIDATPDQAMATAALTSAYGLGRQLWSRIQKARGVADVPAGVYTEDALAAAVAKVEPGH